MNNRKLCIALVVSKWHLYGLEAYLLENNINSQNTDIHIFIAYHEPSRAYRVSESDFKVIDSKKSSINYIKSSNEIFSYIQRNNLVKEKEVLLLNPLEIPLKLIFKLYKAKVKKLDIHILDEGMGTYVSKKIWNQSTENQKISKDNRLKKELKKYIGIILQIVIKPNRHFLYNVERGKLSLNCNIANSYKNYFKVLRSDESKIDEIQNGDILLVSDNLSFICKSKTDEIKQYQNIVNALRDKYPNKKIFLKPHPNELNELSKFNSLNSISILDRKISFEDLVNNNKIDYIMGFCSTSLLTGKSLFNKECYCLNLLLDNSLLSDFGKEYTKYFLDLIEDIGIKRFS